MQHKRDNVKRSICLLAAILLVASCSTLATAANVTKVEIHGVVFDEKSSTYNTTLQWDAQNFTGFWYNLIAGKSSETLKIDQTASSLTAGSRVIQQEKLLYNTSRTDAKFGLFSNVNKKVENGLEYNSTTGFTKNTTGGWYAQLGWFGGKYVAVNGKANKLAKLLINHGSDIKDKKTLKLGTTWSLGEGYNLTLEALDTRTSPRQAWLSLSKDGKTFDNKVVNEGDVYTYVEKSLKGESDVPVFVTYVESIFTGAEGTATFVQLRYTWLISQNVLEVKAGDKFGVFEVKEANENYLLLYNKDKTINLDQNTVQPLYGDIKFKVADSSTALRFYPIAEKTSPGKYEVRGGAYDQSTYMNLIWDAQRFPGFWYNLIAGKSSETLKIDQTASSLTAGSRVIQQEKLLYNTSRTDAKFGVFSNVNKKVENGLEYNSTTGFTKNTTGGWYAQLGWFGGKYVAVNGKANKLAKLLINHGTDIKDKKTLTIGETWSLGEGYNLTAQAIDAKASPRQAHLIFSKDGNKLDDKIVTEGQVYTYVQKSIAGESDVPVLATYVESIFAGTTSDIVQLRYTWFISHNVFEIKAGDKLGVFEVKEANENYVLLYNKDNTINLDQNTVQPLYGELKFKVADSSIALRFYPVFEHTILAASQVEAKASNSATNATPTITSTAVAPASAPVQVAAPTVVQTTLVKTTPTNIPAPKQLGFEALYAIAGIVIFLAIIIRRNKR